jgi:hypothetical protein
MHSKFKVMSRPTVNRRQAPILGLKTRYLISVSCEFLDVGLLSDERTGLNFTMHNFHKNSVSPGSVQQIVPYP